MSAAAPSGGIATPGALQKAVQCAIQPKTKDEF
jgi:hypothetical protein